VKPAEVWVAIGPAVRPPLAVTLFDFEGRESAWAEGWTTSGSAWGEGPMQGKADGDQGDVWRFGGDRWVSSMHGGDEATGNLNSPPFELTGASLHIRLGGGVGSFDKDALRVELLVDGDVVRSVYPPAPPSERFREVTMDLTGLPRDSIARLRFVDDATDAWGHMNVDEIWLMPN
jgi:fructan beta-fructosidase